ncbi:MAG: hypothetical protein SFX18_02600 [Pirellulales bacterium]|nr:hypothetical protein [Pirellulales bacterium]
MQKEFGDETVVVISSFGECVPADKFSKRSPNQAGCLPSVRYEPKYSGLPNSAADAELSGSQLSEEQDYRKLRRLIVASRHQGGGAVSSLLTAP